MVNNCEIESIYLNKMPPIHTKQNETFMLCNCIYLYNTLWFDRHQILNHKTLCPSRSNRMTMTDDRSMEGRGGLNDCRGWCKRSVIEGQKHNATQQSANNTNLFLFPLPGIDCQWISGFWKEKDLPLCFFRLICAVACYWWLWSSGCDLTFV